MKLIDLTPKYIQEISAREKVVISSLETQMGEQLAGWTMGSDQLSKGSVSFQSDGERILIGSATAPLTGTGIFIGKDGNDYEFRAGNPSGAYIHWDGTNLIVSAITLTGGTIKYGKTSFADNVNAGYYMGAEGIYFGAATDTSKLKYTIADGTFDFIGTISSRSSATIAAAINSSGNLITDIINARINTDSRKILSNFDFGTASYAGGFVSGDITWNPTTGAITGGSGVILYRNGIVGASGGVTTFSIDALTGNAIFGGSLIAATGTLGALTIASGGNIKLGQTAYDTGTGFWIGDASGTPKFSIGNSSGDKITWDGSAITVVGTSYISDAYKGDGSGGDVVISVNTTLTSDKFYNNLTINEGIYLNTAGYRIFLKETLNWNGQIQANGGNGVAGTDGNGTVQGTGGAGGAAVGAGFFPASAIGRNGGEGGASGNSPDPGQDGLALSYSIGGAGKAGGNGGTGSGGQPGAAGGAAGTVTAATHNFAKILSPNLAITFMDFPAAANPQFYTGYSNSGGGGGGGASGNGVAGGGGGGSGANGGYLWISAKKIIIGANGFLRVAGGDGGKGGNGEDAWDVTYASGGGGAGGGSGGQGGIAVLMYNSLVNNGEALTAANCCFGGYGGAKGTGGNGFGAGGPGADGIAGVAGNNGAIFQIKLT